MHDPVDVPQTEAEAIALGYERIENPDHRLIEKAGVIRKSCSDAGMETGDLCLQSLCENHTITACYCNGASCDKCYAIPC